MPIYYRINVEKELKKRGLTKIINKATLESIKRDGGIDFVTLAKLCKALEMQPGDIIAYLPTDVYLTAMKCLSEQDPTDKYAAATYVKSKLDSIRNNP